MVALAVILGAVACLMINFNLVSALTSDQRYNSGYNHGCSDGKQDGHYYLDRSGGPSQHTQIFMQGYNDGYRDCYSGSSTFTPTPTNRQDLFNNANMCQTVAKYLLNPCRAYVDSNGILSAEGQRAKGCISNGIMISGIGIVSHLPTFAIIGILKPLSEKTGCGGIVNWALIETDVYSADAFLKLLGII